MNFNTYLENINNNLTPVWNNMQSSVSSFATNCYDQAPVLLNNVKDSIPGSIPRFFGSGPMGTVVVASLESVSVLANATAIVLTAEVAFRVLSQPFTYLGLTPAANTFLEKRTSSTTLRPFQRLSNKELLIKLIACASFGIILNEYTKIASNNAASELNGVLSLLGSLRNSQTSYLETIASYVEGFRN